MSALPESDMAFQQAQGLFLCHFRSGRIERHFERLVRETAGLISWHFTDGPLRRVDRGTRPVYPPAAARMPDRHAEMVRNGGVQGGYMDVVIVPRALDLAAPFVWAMEYDVDYAGEWDRFFEQFERCGADLLTSTLASASDDPGWYYWRSSLSPDGHAARFRAFHPLMRLSRRFLEAYAARMALPGWQGHYEFVIPSFAAASGLSMEDIGGTSRFCPPERIGRNYRNTPGRWRLAPGTFVWRPSLPAYFHERPELFPEAGMLYHPVKADVPEWDGGLRQRVWRGRLGSLLGRKPA